MRDDAALKRLLDGKSRLTPYVGRFVGFDGVMAVVDLGDQRVPVPFLTGFVPDVNEPVHVWSVDGSMFLVGPTAPKPGMGVVETISGDFVTVQTDVGKFTMPFGPPSEPPTSGDAVAIIWPGPSCMKLSTSPDPVPPPPDPGGGGTGQVRTAEFRATAAGSTDRGEARFWTQQVYASNSTYGIWAYGSAIKDTIPESAEFVDLQVYVAQQQRQGGAPRWVLHNQYGLGLPTVSGYTEWSPVGGWQTPPEAESWFNELKQGGGWAGVGLNQGGFNIFKSLAQDGLSGALKITWRS